MTKTGGAYLLTHCQSGVTVDLTHLIKNPYHTSVPVVLVSKCKKDAKAEQTHWLDSLHMPTIKVLASTIKPCATIVEWFYACLSVKGCR